METPSTILHEFQRVRQLPKERREHGDYRYLETTERMRRIQKILEDLSEVSASLMVESGRPDNRGPSQRHVDLLAARNIELTHHRFDQLEQFEELGIEKKQLDENRKMLLDGREETLQRLHFQTRRLVRPESN